MAFKKGMKLICKQCGEEFKVYPYRENIAKFCSRKCHHLFTRGKPKLKGWHHTKKSKLKMSMAKLGKKRLTKEELYNLYWNEKKSSIEIAKLFGASKTIILDWMREYNIKRRTHSESHKLVTGKKHPSWKGGKSIKLICQYCGNSFKVFPCREKNAEYCSIQCWHKAGYSEESRFKMSKSQLRILEQPEKKKEYLQRILNRIKIKPNKSELFVDSIIQTKFPNKFLFNVSRKTIINGHIPDWIANNGIKAVILFNGLWWHLWKFQETNPNYTKEDEERRLDKPYEELNFKVLHIWEDELNNLDSVKNKISEFCGGN